MNRITVGDPDDKGASDKFSQPREVSNFICFQEVAGSFIPCNVVQPNRADKEHRGARCWEGP